MRIHFIAIGGAVMHNMALALHKKGHLVSGSDDEIFEPAKSRLEKSGLLPEPGWDRSRINKDIDVVILGMHARDDNPELAEARALDIDIKSFPEFLYEQTRDKQRVVIGGSHGKTTITSMVMHVLKSCEIKFDYMVGSLIEGFDTMVGLEEGAEIAVFEGDEYLTSALDLRPKFHLYKPDIAVISGIAWDHINVFPEFENYIEQFRIFTDMIMPGGKLVYYEDDELVKDIAEKSRTDIRKIPYRECLFTIGPRGSILRHNNKEYELKVFGKHNLQNINAAMKVCSVLGISEDDFLKSITDFTGSAKRLQLLAERNNKAVYLDFAHAPSKVRATVSAIAERYPAHLKICCLELHTFSSLSTGFLNEYKDCLSGSDSGYVYYNPHVLELKKLDPISTDFIKDSFGEGLSKVFISSEEMIEEIKKIASARVVYLFMSSGDFNGTDFETLSDTLIAE